MPDLSERIDSFPDLAPEERAGLEAEIRARRPELLPDFEAAQRLSDVIEAARRAPPVDPLATLLAAEYENTLTDVQQAALDDVRARMADDPDLRARYEALAERLTMLAPPNPAAEFARLRAAAPRPAATIHVLRPQLIRYALAACFIGLALYGALGIASRASQSELDRIVAFDPDEAGPGALSATVRGEARPVSPAEAYAAGLRALADARHTTLGLFPRYDAALLAEAEARLQTAVNTEAAGTLLSYEAAFFLGKVRVARGDLAGGREAFAYVASSGGARAEEAARYAARLQVQIEKQTAR